MTCMEMCGNGVWIIGMIIIGIPPVTGVPGKRKIVRDRPAWSVAAVGSIRRRTVAVPTGTGAIRTAGATSWAFV